MKPLTKAPYCVGLIHYGDLEPTLSAVAQVHAQSVLPLAVCVVDNQGLFQHEINRINKAGAEVISPGRNTGYAGGLNLLLAWFRGTSADLLWVLNTDVILREEAAEIVITAQTRLPGWDVLGTYVTEAGRLWFGGGTYSRRTTRAAHSNYGDEVPMQSVPPGVRRVDWINGCSIWINRHGAAADRRLDEHFFLYREELEWQVRHPPLRSFIIEAPLVEHDAGAVTGGTGAGLGRVFMARNSWTMASRAQRRHRPVARLAWALDYLLVPLAHGDLAAIGAAVQGLRLIEADGEEIVKEMLGEGR